MQADAVSNYTFSLMKEVFYSNTELLTFFSNGLSRIETPPYLCLMDSSPLLFFPSFLSLALTLPILCTGSFYILKSHLRDFLTDYNDIGLFSQLQS